MEQIRLLPSIAFIDTGRSVLAVEFRDVCNTLFSHE